MRQGYIILVCSKDQITKGVDGTTLVLGRKTKPDRYILDETQAIKEAMAAAEDNPKTPVVLMKTIEVFETKTPEVIRKHYNDKGELTAK